MEARAWVLNFDADLELAFGAGYQAPAFVAARASALRARLAPLVAAGDIVVGAAGGPLGEVDLEGMRGHAFCMTPSARRTLREVGALPVAAPDFEVLRAVNHRGFCSDLGQTLEGAAFARSLEEVRAAVAGISRTGEALLKRPFAFAGRGQRRISRELSAADVAWLRATPVAGGVQVEPALSIIVEHSIHGVLSAEGGLRLGPVVLQACDPRGAWEVTRPLSPSLLEEAEVEAACAEAEAVARALTATGYFGPFGVDGFVYRRGARRAHQPRSEINARYTMGWSLGPPGLLG